MHRPIRSTLALAALLAAFLPGLARGTSDALTHPVNYDPLPTYEGSGQVVEPDVIFVNQPGGWHGWEYWMVMTPYVCGDETTENPSILASHDGQTWVVPSVNGVYPPQPLVPNNESCSSYYDVNNDPSIVLVGDSLYIYYQVTHGRSGGTTDIRRIASADGVHWTSGSSAPTLWSKANYPLSQTVVYVNGTYYMWYIYTSACNDPGTAIRRRTSTDGLTWPDANDQPVTSTQNFQGVPFHLTIKNFGGTYAMLYIAPLAGDCGHHGLYYAESSDGMNWTSQTQAMLTPSDTSWDNRSIYRASFLGRYPNFEVWYSAEGATGCYWCSGRYLGYPWHVGVTSIGDYLPPAPVSLSGSGGCYDHIFLDWIAPGDDGNTGTATAYDVRWSSSPITEANFAFATPVAMTAPQPAGSAEQDSVPVPRCSTGRYYALRTRDEVNNWSPVSNCVFARPGCPRPPIQCFDASAAPPRTEGPNSPAALELAEPSPNPAAIGDVRLTFGVPAVQAGENYELAVFDLVGRRVATLEQGRAVAGYRTVTWNLRTTGGDRVGRGIYFVRLRFGATVLTRRVIALE